ncbi:MAG TPA: single-stranded DNA-binding protein [Kosmotogaceae bacterium]|nr:single-stranded DNA-binding protein [Kosmotogaceae bacterium]
MSISYNKIILVGRLTRDPEMKFSPSGTQISTFSLAVDRNTRSGREDDSTDFVRIVTFGKLAEFCGNYLAKGRLVLVEGSLRIRRWKTQEGEPRSTTEVLANTIRFMETKAQAGITHENSRTEDDGKFNDNDDGITFFGNDSDDSKSDEVPF